MPELPEVETICNILREGGEGVPSLIGVQIHGAAIFWPKSLAQPQPEEFLAAVQGQVFEKIGRRGKYFIFRLSSGYLLVHLRMSGDLVMEQQAIPLDTHCRLCIYLEDGWRLSFNDTRKFGRVWYVDDPQTVLSSLGPEPLGQEITGDQFYQRLQSRHRQVKPLLLDQQFLAGLGNIYSDEALHLAGLHPLTLSNQIDVRQAKGLWTAIQKVLEAGIRHNGSSIDWVYRGGDFQNYFRVYGRAGEPCLTCGTPIQRIIVGQRGTHYCPVCQPEVG